MKNNLPAAIFVTVLFAIAATLWWHFSAESDSSSGFSSSNSAALVSLQPVQLELVIDRVEAIGTLVANESVTINAKVTETVSALHFEDGDLVEIGDVLVELTNQEQSALLAEARANLTDARLQLERLERLGSKVASASQIDEARARYDGNQAKLDATISRMEDRLIRAPFSGMLGFREVSPGTLLTPSTAITTLDDISTLKLDFSVPETAFGAVQAGDKIEAHSAAYPRLDFFGEVASVGSRIDPVTRTAQVRALLANDQRLLRPGMLMTLSLIADQQELTVIPEAALLQKGIRSLVYVANEDMQVFERDVVIDRRLPGSVVISSGLDLGELIVVDGVMAVQNGSQVRVPEIETEAEDELSFSSAQ